LGEHLPQLTVFALFLMLTLTLPRLMQRWHLPGPIGFILAGILLGPQVLGAIRMHGPIVQFFADIGKLLLMFLAGFEVDMVEFARARTESAFFGALTFTFPFMAGALVVFTAGYSFNACALIGSILASHTLVGLPLVKKAELIGRECVLVTMGATVFTDILSILILAICLSIHVAGFSTVTLGLEMLELVIYVPAVLFGLTWVARFLLRLFGKSKSARVVVFFLLMAGAAQGAEWIHLEGIIGAFLAGIATKRAFYGTPTEDTLEVIAQSLFIPAFFVSAGLLIDFKIFFATLFHHPLLVVGIVGSLLGGKWVAARLTGKALRYRPEERFLMFSLSVPQVAATLAIALVAYSTKNGAGVRLIDEAMLNTTIVLVIVSSVAGLFWVNKAAALLKRADELPFPETPSTSPPAPELA
jgi:Na+:H+ antiporter